MLLRISIFPLTRCSWINITHKTKMKEAFMPLTVDKFNSLTLSDIRLEWKKNPRLCWNDNLKPRLWRHNKYYTGSSEHVSVQVLTESVSMDGKDLIQSSGSVMARGEINKTFRHAKHSTHDSKARCDRWAPIQRGCDEVRAGVRSLLQR